MASAAPADRHTAEFPEDLDEPEVLSKGLPPPRPALFVVVEAEADVTTVEAEDGAVSVAGGDIAIVESSGVERIGAEDVGAGTTVKLVVSTVDCTGAGCTVDCIGVLSTAVDAGGIMVKEPTDGVTTGTDVVTMTGGAEVWTIADDVLVVDVVPSVTSPNMHASTTSKPLWAKSSTEFWAAFTVLQLSSMVSSMDRIPLRQSLEQRLPVKSAAVQLVMVAWYARLQAIGSTPSWIGWRSFREIADVVDTRAASGQRRAVARHLERAALPMVEYGAADRLQLALRHPYYRDKWFCSRSFQSGFLLRL